MVTAASFGGNNSPPTRSRSFQRFLQTVGASLGYRAQDWRKLGPDDDLGTFHHRWSGSDGMELIELVMSLEREYSLELPEEFLSSPKTLGELFDHVMRTAARPFVPSGAGPEQHKE